jgi:EAL domain-containing protein (putative c-di-GMP-specific phosphodiesterase class I)
MDDALVSTETLVRLRLKGFKLSVDDFGTGYSSLLRLKQLPFTEIKIDKSFVANVHGSRDDAAITKAIIQLARSLDLRCVIEGAETQQAIDYAAGLGCDEAQGYFISKPLASAQLEAFLKTWQWRKNALAAKPAEPLSVVQAAGDQSA